MPIFENYIFDYSVLVFSYRRYLEWMLQVTQCIHPQLIRLLTMTQGSALSTDPVRPVHRNIPTSSSERRTARLRTLAAPVCKKLDVAPIPSEGIVSCYLLNKIVSIQKAQMRTRRPVAETIHG